MHSSIYTYVKWAIKNTTDLHIFKVVHYKTDKSVNFNLQKDLSVL